MGFITFLLNLHCSFLANIAVAAGGFVHIITYFLPMITIESAQYPNMSAAKKIALCLLPNSCLA